jgi:hypothetical protein
VGKGAKTRFYVVRQLGRIGHCVRPAIFTTQTPSHRKDQIMRGR